MASLRDIEERLAELENEIRVIKECLIEQNMVVSAISTERVSLLARLLDEEFTRGADIPRKPSQSETKKEDAA